MKRGILEMAAINSNLKHTKIISRLCEKCVITAKVDVVVLRAVGKPTAFWCWFLSSKRKENELNGSILGGTSETNVGRKFKPLISCCWLTLALGFAT